MNLRVYEMAHEAERKLVDRQAERGWQVEQAAALRSRQAPNLARRVIAMLGTALGLMRRSGRSSMSSPPAQTAPSATLSQEMHQSRGSRQRPACATGD